MVIVLILFFPVPYGLYRCDGEISMTRVCRPLMKSYLFVVLKMVELSHLGMPF